MAMERAGLIVATSLLLLWRYQQILGTVNASRVHITAPMEEGSIFVNSSTPAAINNWITDVSTRRYRACKVVASDVVDSFIIMRYISTAPANEITIDITYMLRCCNSYFSWQHSIGLHFFLSSTRYLIPNPNTSPYTYVEELGNTSVMESHTLTLFNSKKTIEMKGFRGIYLSFRDRGICGTINSVSIHYFVCPYSSLELMRFPTTVAPNISTAVVRINGACVAHSEPRKGNNFMLCYANGTSKFQGGCQCLAGYQNVSSSQCTECPPKTFKDSSGNFQCRICGANVVDGKLPRISVCECMPGFYRPTNRASFYYVNCEEPPSAPRKLSATETSSTWVLLKWMDPLNAGTGDGLAYEILSYGNYPYKTRHTYFNLTGLKTFTYHTVTVSAINNVTKAIHRRFKASVSFKTLSGLPSAVIGLEIERNADHSVTIYWKKPVAEGGSDLKYFVIISNDQGRFVRLRNYTIYQDEETRKYVVSVKAHTVAGFSDERSISFEIRGKKSGGISIEVATGIGSCLLAALLIVILIFLVLYFRDRRKRKGIERSAAMNLADIRRNLGMESCKDEDDNPVVVANRSYEDVLTMKNQIAVIRAVSMNLPGNVDVDSCQDERNASPALIANRVYEDLQDLRNEKSLKNTVATNSPGNLGVHSSESEDNAKPVAIVNKSYEPLRRFQTKHKHEHCYEVVK